MAVLSSGGLQRSACCKRIPPFLEGIAVVWLPRSYGSGIRVGYTLSARMDTIQAINRQFTVN